MRIRAPLYFERFGHRLKWAVWTPAGRDLRHCAELRYGQFQSNRGGRRLRYFVRWFNFFHWRARVARVKTMGA